MTTALRYVARTYPIAVVSGGLTEPTTLLLHWSEEDPAAVNLTIEDPWRSEDDRVVEWIIGRSLMIAACLPQFRDISVGMGNVKVRHRGGSATISLQSEEGACVLVMRGEVLTDFLKGVAAVMPFGDEGAESAIYAGHFDRGITALLDGAE